MLKYGAFRAPPIETIDRSQIRSFQRVALACDGEVFADPGLTFSALAWGMRSAMPRIDSIPPQPAMAASHMRQRNLLGESGVIATSHKGVALWVK